MIFGVLTTIIAFVPLLLVEVDVGKLAQIPLVVSLALFLKSKPILPAHKYQIKLKNIIVGLIAVVTESFPVF